jgi:hypothetical protein
MTAATTFPRRDSARRIVSARDLAGVALAGAVAGAVALVLLDGLFALLGLGDFGRVNGWLAVILPVMIFVEEFRAWRGARARAAVALVAAALGALAGLIVAGLAGALPGDLPRPVPGALGAATLAVAYSLVWYYGIRAAGGRTDEGEGVA